MAYINQQVLLVKHPVGVPQPDDFKLVESPVRDLEDGEVLFKTLYVSLDPAMRGWMNEGPNYVTPYALGEPMWESSISVVEQTRNPNLKVGDVVLGAGGFQKYFITNGELASEKNYKRGAMRILPAQIPPALFLGVLGMPGFTGYWGLLTIGEPNPGETVVVAAATGGVGSMVGQFAKLKGCRVVGIAGGADKCKYAVEELGFDVCLDHKLPSLEEDLKKACPDGIDIYFENVGGRVFWAVLPLLNQNARIPICGVISRYNSTELPEGPDRTPLIMRASIGKRLKFQGFLIMDHFPEIGEFMSEVAPLVLSGKIKHKEHITKGLENFHEAFTGMLEGRNFGKAIIEV